MQHASTLEAPPRDPKRQELRDEFTKKKGHWHETWETF